MDLHRFSRALRLRWLWLSWTSPQRPWNGMQLPCNDDDRALFTASTSVTLGDGTTASFWKCPWTGEGALKTVYPSLFRHSRRKNRTVKEALQGNTWIADLAHGDTTHLWVDVLRLHRWIQEADIQLIEQARDQIKWRHEASGTYSANSAYKAQFLGRTTSEISNFTWKTWAPQRLKIFIWLLTKNRLWCNDRLQRRDWQNNYFRSEERRVGKEC